MFILYYARTIALATYYYRHRSIFHPFGNLHTKYHRDPPMTCQGLVIPLHYTRAIFGRTGIIPYYVYHSAHTLLRADGIPHSYSPYGIFRTDSYSYFVQFYHEMDTWSDRSRLRPKWIRPHHTCRIPCLIMESTYSRSITCSRFKLPILISLILICTFAEIQHNGVRHTVCSPVLVVSSTSYRRRHPVP